MKTIQIIIVLIQLLLINNVNSTIQLSDLTKNTITDLVQTQQNKISFTLTLAPGLTYNDYLETLFIKFTNTLQATICTTTKATSTLLMVDCSGIDDILPNPYLELTFNPASGGKATALVMQLILVHIDSHVQDRQFMKIVGVGFEGWVQKDKVQVFDQVSQIELQVLSVESQLINISLTGLPGSTNGNLVLKYLGEKVNEFGNNFYPQITSIIPSGIINTNVDVTIKGMFFIGYLYSELLFTGQSDTAPVTFQLVSDHEILILYQNLNDYYGEVFANYKHTSAQANILVDTLSPVNIPLYFAKSSISLVSYEQGINGLIVNGAFIDTKLFMDNPIVYKGNGFTNSSLLSLNYSNNTISFSLNDKRVYYGKELELVIDQTSTFIDVNLFEPILLKFDKPISRSDKIIYYSGEFLEMVNGDGVALYEMSLHIASNDTFIPCDEFGEIDFNSIGHIYNMYCKTSLDLYPMVTNLVIKPAHSSSYQMSLLYDKMTVDSVSSTVYGIPNQLVTITGKSIEFVTIVTIGGVNCTDVKFKFVENRGQPSIEKLECLFISNVGTLQSELQVVLIDPYGLSASRVEYNSFLYNIDKPCPTGSKNGLICSGPTNGECITTSRECKCFTGFGGYDCSIVLTNTNPNPTINKTITIIETNTSKFEIGLIQIREIEPINNNKVIKFIDLKKQVWDLSSTSFINSNFTLYTYNTTTTDNCIINVIISIYNSSSNNNNYQQYNFFGDIINIIPNSVKYNVEISNWKFNSKLNAIQVIFESQIINECKQQKEIENNIQKNGESIRSIQMKLKNGDYLVGTFSNRVKVDNRIILSKIELLPNDDFINNDNKNNNLLIQSITVGHFENKTIIDPSFGVLLSSSSGDNETDCDDNSRKWVLPVAIVVSVVGAAFNNASYLNVDEYNEMLLSGSSGVSSKASTTMYTVPPVDSTTSTTATIVSTTTMLPTTTTTTTMVPTTTATTTMTPTTISPTLSSTTAYSTGGITPSPTVTNETTISTGGSGTSSSTTGIPTTTPLPTTPASTFFISKNAFLVDRPTSFNITCSNKSINFVTHQIAVTATNIYKSFYLDCSVTREVDYATATCNFAQSVMGNQFINSGKLINIVTSTLNGTVPATTYQINSPFLAHNQYVNITGYGFTQISDPSVVSVKDRNGVVLSTQMFETYMLVNLFGLPGDTNGKFYVYIYGEQIIYYQFSTLTPYLTSVSNSILNINDQLTIKGTLFRVPTEAKVQIILNGAIVKIITYNYIDQNTITIPTIETSSLSGEALITFEQTISGSVGFNLPSNQISVSFALPNISNVVYNFNNNQLVVSGTFLNPQIGITYLNGIVYDSVAPDSITSTSSQLVYVNPKIFYGELYLSCYQTNSVLHSEFSVKITPTPLQLDKVPVRKSKTIYFSGQFLSPVDRDGNQLYKATISSTHTGTSVETIECKDFNAKYLGTKQLYNVSCTVDKYISNPTTFSVTLIVGTSITVPLPFSYAPPTITSVSSTVYGVPGQITISGTSFCSNAIISIGGVNCTNPSILPSTSTDILDKLVCSFSSNSGSGYTTNALPVSIACDDQVITLESSFLYSIDKPCPTSTNGLICSGSTNGECIATTKECKCNKGFGGFDCSIVIVDLVPPPTPKVTNNALTIIDSGSKNSGSGSDGSGSSNNNGGGNPNNNLEGQVRFDIGIIQIREIESYNNDKVVRYVDLKTQIWEQSTIVDDTTKTTSYLYNVTVVATNIQILIIVNSDQTIQHDFLGDTIELLPNSVKYELSITNWEFAAKLNTIQVLFESKVTNDCQQQDGSIISNNNKLLMNGESIRSIEMKTSSGKTLVGTFSNRMKVDDKTVVSKIEILSNEQLLASDIIVDTTNGGNSVIQAVSVGYFEQKTIIDPSFAVLVGSDNSNNGQLDICGNPIDNSPSKLANWKIAVAVVCSAVGVALIFVTTAVTYKKIRNKSLMLDIRLKLSRRG